MKFDTVYIGVCSWCCEIVVGTKNSSLNSWQVVFFKHEKSTMENFYDPTINFYVPIRISLNYDKHFNFFFKGCSIFIEWNIYIYIYVCVCVCVCVEGLVAELTSLHTQSV